MTRKELLCKLVEADLKKYTRIRTVSETTIAELGYSLNKLGKLIDYYSGEVNINLYTGRERTELLSRKYNITKELIEELRLFRNSVIHLNKSLIVTEIKGNKLIIDEPRTLLNIKSKSLALINEVKMVSQAIISTKDTTTTTKAATTTTNAKAITVAKATTTNTKAKDVSAQW